MIFMLQWTLAAENLLGALVINGPSRENTSDIDPAPSLVSSSSHIRGPWLIS